MKIINIFDLPIYETTLNKPEYGLMKMNRTSSDELSGKNSHFNAGIDVSIVTKTIE